MNVTVYSTTTCGICHALMQWLEKQDVAYKNVVIDTSPEAMEELITVSEGAIGTPFSVVDNDGAITKIAGFDQKQFRAALGL